MCCYVWVFGQQYGNVLFISFHNSHFFTTQTHTSIHINHTAFICHIYFYYNEKEKESWLTVSRANGVCQTIFFVCPFAEKWIENSQSILEHVAIKLSRCWAGRIFCCCCTIWLNWFQGCIIIIFIIIYGGIKFKIKSGLSKCAHMIYLVCLLMQCFSASGIHQIDSEWDSSQAVRQAGWKWTYFSNVNTRLWPRFYELIIISFSLIVFTSWSFQFIIKKCERKRWWSDCGDGKYFTFWNQLNRMTHWRSSIHSR